MISINEKMFGLANVSGAFIAGVVLAHPSYFIPLVEKLGDAWIPVVLIFVGTPLAYKWLDSKIQLNFQNQEHENNEELRSLKDKNNSLESELIILTGNVDLEKPIQHPLQGTVDQLRKVSKAYQQPIVPTVEEIK